MPRSYVDNSYNRSVGRVGMEVGSAVISRSSGGEGSSYGTSSGGGSGSAYGSSGGGGGYSYGGGSGAGSSSRTYVDNAYNRSVGRVGLELGSAVVSRSGGDSSSKASYGASGGGGSGVGSSSSRTYVDNSYNRSVGRVGLEVGSAIVSRSGGATNSSCAESKTYVDNSYNRSAGRVGLPIGTAVMSRSRNSRAASSTSSALGKSTLGAKYYVDNAYNRRVGRVGMPLGTAPLSQASKSAGPPYSNSSNAGNTRKYVDNAFNRRLGRVGKPVGTAVYTAASRSSEVSQQKYRRRPEIFDPLFDFDPEHPRLDDIYDQIARRRQEHKDEPDYVRDCDVARGILNRHDAAIAQSQAKFQRPQWLHNGEVIEWNDLEIGEKLGGGGFGDVHVAIWQKEYQVVIKKLRVQRVHQKKKAEFEQEVKVFSRLRHPAIVEFYGACVETPNIAIVMEFMAGGSLYDVLHIECRKLKFVQKFKMGKDILSALAYIHEHKVVHRDIKSMNVLVCEGLHHCKLGDFGLALKEENQSSSSLADYSVVGTLRYSSPEMLRGERLTVTQLMAADVYAAALTINELFMEEIPFDRMNQHQVRKAVLDGERPEPSSYVEYPSCLVRLLKRGMSGSVNERPTAEQFLEKFKSRCKILVLSLSS